MDETNVTLTDEEVEEVINAANEVNAGNESIENLKKAKDMSIDELLDENEEEKRVAITINPETGVIEGVGKPNDGYGYDSDNDLFDDFDDLQPSKEIDRDFTDSQISNSLTTEDEKYKPSIQDITTIRELLIKKGEGKEIKYVDLPNYLRDKIDKIITREYGRGMANKYSKMAKNALASQLLEDIYTNILSEKLKDACVDLETSIKNLVKNEYADIASQQHRQELHTFIYKFPELAETKYKDDPEKSKLLMNVSDGYKEAHTLEKMYDKYCHSGKQMKVRHIDLENMHKVIRDFNMKYDKSTLTIRDFSSAPQILSRYVNKRFSMDVIKGFIIVFCKYTRMMNPNNLDEHTFMYYFINNILSLDVPTVDQADTDWKDEFIENVNHFLCAIDDRLNKTN